MTSQQTVYIVDDDEGVRDGFGLLMNTVGQKYEVYSSAIEFLESYNPDMTGWEEKENFVNFKLVEIKSDELSFDGLTMKKVSNTNMLIEVEIKRDGEINTFSFDYERQ